MARFHFPTLFFLLILSCTDRNENDITKSYFNIDSLINNQVAYLIAKKISVTKYASINNKWDTTQVTPDSLGWLNELSVFKNLDIINKPIYQGSYSITNTKDPNSNLTLKSYVANRDIPIQEFKIYYLATFDNIKKIEAITTETNTLYSTHRKMRLDFDKVLIGYELNGVQKMIMSDTVEFSIRSRIVTP